MIYKTINMLKDLIFDLDDTLINTYNSKEIVVLKMLKNYSGKNLNILEIKKLIKENKQNDYIDTINIILNTFGINIDINDLVNNFDNIYLNEVKNVEKLIIDYKTLDYLKSKYNLYIATGRPRKFYDGIWKNELSKHFKGVICHGDFNDVKRKPYPDIINKIIEKYNLNAEYYVGNSINDIIASHQAGLKSIFVKHTFDNMKIISEYKPEVILENVNDLINVL